MPRRREVVGLFTLKKRETGGVNRGRDLKERVGLAGEREGEPTSLKGGERGSDGPEERRQRGTFWTAYCTVQAGSPQVVRALCCRPEDGGNSALRLCTRSGGLQKAQRGWERLVTTI